MRHAKSSWDSPTLSDFDRPLNERGNHDAPMMAQRLKDYGFNPQLIIHSVAVRTTCTAQALHAKFPNAQMIGKYELYNASWQELERVVQHTDNQYDRLVLIGHNPGVSDFLDRLTGESLHMVTAAQALVDFYLETWSHIGLHTGVMTYYNFPKLQDLFH